MSVTPCPTAHDRPACQSSGFTARAACSAADRIRSYSKTNEIVPVKKPPLTSVVLFSQFPPIAVEFTCAIGCMNPTV